MQLACNRTTVAIIMNSYLKDKPVYIYIFDGHPVIFYQNVHIQPLVLLVKISIMTHHSADMAGRWDVVDA